jgi:serine/threonine protein phosphatase 1
MSTVAIGDVHGNRAALDDLLGRLRPELGKGDTVVFLGDYIDRGPDSKGCIESILHFRASIPAAVVALLGNHEDWLLATICDPRRHSWLLGMEALATIASYSDQATATIRRAAEAAGPRLITEHSILPYEVFLNSMPPEHLDFLNGLKLFHRTSDALCAHGGLDVDVEGFEAQTREAFIWGTERFLTEYDGPEIVVYGHWDNCALDEHAWPVPAFGAASIGIDSISQGVLTSIRLPERRVIQSGRFE